MSARILLGLAIVFLFAANGLAQDSLATARDLYASASYEEALAVLGRVPADASAGAVVEADRYRVLCLIALGRGAEADTVIEAIVTNDPFYQPAAADAAPRVRAAFTSVRQRVLPFVVRNLYAGAKADFERKSYAEAAQAFETTVKVIDGIEGQRGDLEDLRVLASGFLDLSRASIAPPPAAPAPPTVEAAPVPTQPLPTTSLVVLRQGLPPMPFSLASLGSGEYRGVVEVDINESGDVDAARMIQAVHVLYDPLLLRAARDWKYEAPRIAGKATASRKRVEIVLRP